MSENWIDIDVTDNWWLEDANCAGTDTNSFFPYEDGTDTVYRHYEHRDLIQKVCDSCGVKDECLAFAIRYNVLGFWGGTTERQRDQIRIAYNIQAQSIVLEDVPPTGEHCTDSDAEALGTIN